MSWKKIFETTDPETGEKTQAKVNVNKDGVVTGYGSGYEYDKTGGYHGHVWNLDKEAEDIGGRDPKDSSGQSIYGDDDSEDDE